MKAKSLSKNSFYYLVYNVLNLLFPFITGIYVTHVLLPDNIGQVAYAQNIAQYFVIFAFLGIPTYGLREVSKVRDDRGQLNKLFSELVIINFISTACFLSIYTAMVFAVPSFRSNLALYLIVGALIAFNVFDISWFYEGLEEFGFISLRNILVKAASFVLLVLFVKQDSDYLIYAAITVCATGGNCIINMLASPRFVKLTFRGLSLKRHLKPILFLVAVNLAIEIYTLVDTTMLGMFCEKETVAYYSYGGKIQKILLQVMNSFTMVIVPRLSCYCKENRTDEFNGLLSKTVRLIVCLSLPLIVGLGFTAGYAINLLYGEAYVSSSYVLRILSILILVSPIGYLLGSRVCLVTGHENKMLMAVGIGAVTNIAGNLLLIRPYGEYGAAIASVASEIIVMLVYIALGKKYFRLRGIAADCLKCVLSVAAMAGVLCVIELFDFHPILKLAAEVLCGALVYVLMIFVLREQIATEVLSKLKGKFKHGRA